LKLPGSIGFFLNLLLIRAPEKSDLLQALYQQPLPHECIMSQDIAHIPLLSSIQADASAL
jgi:hypothetical protein